MEKKRPTRRLVSFVLRIIAYCKNPLSSAVTGMILMLSSGSVMMATPER